MADFPRELGGETKMLGHALRPALDRGQSRRGVERGVAFDRIEHLRIQAQKLGGPRVLRVQAFAPGVFTPGGATEVIRERILRHGSNVQV